MAVESLWSHLEPQHDTFTLFAHPSYAAPPVTLQRLVTAHNHLEDRYRCPLLSCPQGEVGRVCATPFNLKWYLGPQQQGGGGR